ncbi:hypothetical protein K1719_036204 [Acacia pycnantha]|nr:hypothetical protein K1719_036204 [Acacia pycnantha]
MKNLLVWIFWLQIYHCFNDIGIDSLAYQWIEEGMCEGNKIEYFPLFLEKEIQPHVKPIGREGSTNITEIALKTIPSASKIEIKRVLESLDGFDVKKVRTLNMEGKKKKHGGLLIAKSDYKKAYVTLKNLLSISPDLYLLHIIEEEKKRVIKQSKSSVIFFYVPCEDDTCRYLKYLQPSPKWSSGRGLTSNLQGFVTLPARLEYARGRYGRRFLFVHLNIESRSFTGHVTIFTAFVSHFGAMAANNNMPSALDKEQIFGMAEKEMEYRVELFNKLTHTCFNKCVENKYKESELNMGENSCIDRCVSKYWHVTNLVGQLLGSGPSGRPPM